MPRDSFQPSITDGINVESGTVRPSGLQQLRDIRAGLHRKNYSSVMSVCGSPCARMSRRIYERKEGISETGPSAAIPAAAAIVSGGAARADDGDAKEFLGRGTQTRCPVRRIRPGFLRVPSSRGGVPHETNSFLHPEQYSWLLPNDIVNASDGVGN
jgi:hypothetical protein